MDARITEMNAALDNFQSAFEAMQAEYRAALPDTGTVGPNLALAVERLRHTYQQFQVLRTRMDSFIYMRDVLLLYNDIRLIEEHDPADPVPGCPVVAAQDEPEEPNPAATEGTAENDTTTPGEIEDNTAASVVSVEDNWHQNAIDPNNN